MGLGQRRVDSGLPGGHGLGVEPGDRVPDVTLFDNDVQPVRLVEFAARGPLLLSFYLYDWTGT